MVYKRTIFKHIRLSRPCLLCQNPLGERGICQQCLSLLPVILHACYRCGLPLESTSDRLCGQCLKHPPYIDHTVSLFHYTSPVAQLVCELKFRQGLEYALPLGALMAEHIQARVSELRLELPEVVIPVPLHPKRMRQRGYNQALELARPIARQLGLPIDNHLCLRSRHTHEQSQLAIEDRKRNIRSAFALQEGAKLYRHVAIVDDVVTTGQTVNELARVFKQAGIKRVDVWSCCRA